MNIKYLNLLYSLECPEKLVYNIYIAFHDHYVIFIYACFLHKNNTSLHSKPIAASRVNMHLKRL